MIQRIQTVYLFLVVILSILLLFLPVLNLAEGDGDLRFTFSTLLVSPEGIAFPAGIVFSFLTASLGFFTILQYKQRKIQMKLCWGLLALVLLSGIYTGFGYLYYLPNGATPGYGVVIFPIELILVLLAHGAIKKDEKLVRSMDRLR